MIYSRAINIIIFFRTSLTALHFAAHQNCTEIGLLLLQHAADPLVKDSKCAAALHISTNPPITQWTAFDYAALIMILQWQDFCRHCIGEAA